MLKNLKLNYSKLFKITHYSVPPNRGRLRQQWRWHWRRICGQPAPLDNGRWPPQAQWQWRAALFQVQFWINRGKKPNIRWFRPRGSPRPMGGGQRKFATPPERTPSARGGINGSRPEQMRQEGRLKRQNSDPSPSMKSWKNFIWISIIFK